MECRVGQRVAGPLTEGYVQSDVGNDREGLAAAARGRNGKPPRGLKETGFSTLSGRALSVEGATLSRVAAVIAEGGLRALEGDRCGLHRGISSWTRGG